MDCLTNNTWIEARIEESCCCTVCFGTGRLEMFRSTKLGLQVTYTTVQPRTTASATQKENQVGASIL